MKKLVFVVRDRCIGGFTSSLSNWYNQIKNYFDVKVLQLTEMGDAEIAYENVLVKRSTFCDSYYGDYTLAKGVRKIKIAFVKILAKIDKNIERRIAYSYSKLFQDADLVIAFGEGFATSFVSYIDNCPKIAWIHYDISYYPKSDLDIDLYSKFDRIICVSDAIAKRMRNMYPMLSSRICGLHNIIDEKRICSLSHQRTVHICSNCFNIISIGRFSEVKRFDKIPKLASRLKEMGLYFKWRIIGGGSDAIKDDLVSDIQKYNLRDEVILMGKQSNPFPYLLKSDLLVSTSKTEACPMVFSEARILGVPIVSADFNTAIEFIDNEVDGIICKLEELPAAICSMAFDKDKYHTILMNSNKRGSGNKESLDSFINLVELSLREFHQ